jgi:hypothetical protein
MTTPQTEYPVDVKEKASSASEKDVESTEEVDAAFERRTMFVTSQVSRSFADLPLGAM